MPVVIYCHGNSSSRLEGIKIASELLKRNINLFIFDFAGCGLSEGEYISLGYFERDDLRTIIDFLNKLPGVSKIGVWGRSMGAATCLMYCHSDDRIKAACYDSPFSDFSKLAKELCKKQINLPGFVIDTALSFIRSTIKKRSGADIYKLHPKVFSSKTTTPGFFLHAMYDELIPLDHTLEIVEEYGGYKSLNVCEGTHNSTRSKQLIDKIGKFFQKFLLDDAEAEGNETI